MLSFRRMNTRQKFASVRNSFNPNAIQLPSNPQRKTLSRPGRVMSARELVPAFKGPAASRGERFGLDCRRQAPVPGLRVIGRCEHVHQTSCGFPVPFRLERDVEIGCMTKHVQQRP